VALEEAQTAVRNEGEAYNALGVLWQAEGKRSKARQSYETALSRNDALYAAQYNLGVLALKERRYTEALTSLESAVKNLPEAQAQLDCARKGVEYTQSRDAQAKRRLRDELKNCPAQ
jgi:tetratricopeptide (TPR) repeat protein